MKQKYDIFISYRRDGGLELADSIYQRLINAGYSVFIDLEQLNSGRFNEKLLTVIENCTDFILVLPPNALDRCSDADDWVRLEIEHAKKHNKNIIPIMLRGFEWPAPKRLPNSLQDISTFNGISASDHNVFVENIERLKKSFLKSKPGFTWQRYKKQIIAITIFIACVIGVLSFIHFNNYSKFEKVCNEYSSKIMTEVVKEYYNYTIAQQALDEWNSYIKNFPDRNTSTIEVFISTISHLESQLKEPESFDINENDKNIFRQNSLPIEELEAFPMVIGMTYDETINFFSQIKISAQQEGSLNLYDNDIQLGFKFLNATIMHDYYATLSFFTNMPPCIYQNVQQASSQLGFLADIPIQLSKQEYESKQQAKMNELNEILTKLGGNLHDTKLDLNLQEQKLDKMNEEIEQLFTQ